MRFRAPRGTSLILLLLLAVSAVQLARNYSVQIELGRLKFSRPDESTRERLSRLKEQVFVTYFTSAPGRMPSHMRRVEPAVRNLLASFKSVSGGKLDYQIVDPDADPDLASYASRRGVAPFRTRHVSRDAYSEKTVWSALMIEYGARDSVVIHAIGPEHLPRLQRVFAEHLRQLEEPRLPVIALAAPDAYSELVEVLSKRARVLRVNLDGGSSLPQQADLLFWIEPATMGESRLREVNRFLETGHSLVLTASRHKAVIRQERDHLEVLFRAQPFAAEPLLLDAGLRVHRDLALDQRAEQLTIGSQTVAAPFLIRCLPYEQDFRTFRAQPNGVLSFGVPAPFELDGARLSERGFSAEVLATTSQDTWIQERPESPVSLRALAPERGEPAPKLPLMVLLRHQDPWRGLVLACASSSPFADGSLRDERFAHSRMLDVLLDRLASSERLVYARVGGAESEPLPELTSSSRLLWRVVCVSSLPLLLFAHALFEGRTRPLRRPGEVHARRGLSWTALGSTAVVIALSVLMPKQLRWEATSEKLNGLAPESRRLAQQAAEGEITVEAVFSPRDLLPHRVRPLVKKVDDLLEEFRHAGAKMSVRPIEPERLNPAERAELKGRGIEPSTMTTQEEEGTTIHTFYSTLVFSSGGRREVLPFPDAASFENLEFRIAFALWRLQTGRQVHIGFATDVPRLTPAEAHENYQLKGLFAPAGSDVYSLARDMVRQSGFRVTHINPRQPVIPADMDLLVWLQPRRPAGLMLEATVRYLHQGGSVVIAAQHFNMQSRQYQGQNFGTVYWPQPQSPELEALYFPEIGVRLVREVLFDELKTQVTVESQRYREGKPELERMPSALPFLIRAAASNFSASSPITRGLGDQAFIWANYFELDDKRLGEQGIRATPLIYTSDRTWSYAWKGGWIPDALLTGPARSEDGTPRWLGRKAMAVLLEGSFPLPLTSLVAGQDSTRTADAETHDKAERPVQPGKSPAPGRLLLVACSELFKNAWLRGPEFRGDHFLLNAVATLALPPALASVMARRPVRPGFDYVGPARRLMWRSFIVATLPFVLVLLSVRAGIRSWFGPRESRLPKAPSPQRVDEPAPRPSALVLVLVLVLIACNWGLSYYRALERRPLDRMGRLLPRQLRQHIKLAILQVASGGRFHLYGRQKGIWRCVNYHNAPGDEERIQNLVTGILEAEGRLDPDASSQPWEYGFDASAMRTVSLHGPDFFKDRVNRDLQVLVHLGSSISGRDRCYARLGGKQDVWTIDRDLVKEIASPSENLPPLLDPYVVPKMWSIQAQGLREILVQPSQRGSYRLVLHEPAPGPDAQPPQGLPWQWWLETGGTHQTCNQATAAGYTAFLFAIPWKDVLDPRLWKSLGFEQPDARLTLVPLQGEPLELLLAKSSRERGIVLNTHFDSAYQLDSKILSLLFPSTSTFLGSEKQNPWQEWLDRSGGAFPQSLRFPGSQNLAPGVFAR